MAERTSEAVPLLWGREGSESIDNMKTSSSQLPPSSDFFLHCLINCPAISNTGFSRPPFSVLQLVGQPVEDMLVSRENPNDADLQLGHFVCQSLKEESCSKDIQVFVDKEITIMNRIISFHCSSRFRPDACVCLKLDGQTVPILDMQVQSSLLKNSVSKNVANLTALLRFLRHINGAINKLSGFTIPYPKKHDNDRCAVKTTVTWKNFKFIVNFEDISQEELRFEIVSEVKKVALMLEGCNVPESFNFFIPLSRDELNKVHQSARQLKSRFNILIEVSDQKKIYKLSVEKTDISCLFYNFQRRSLLYLLPSGIAEFCSSFYSFEMLKPPLTTHQARHCLSALVEKCAEAIDQLHKHGFAHLDVRLPNICFRNQKAILIDLDRARPIKHYAGVFSDLFVSCTMYQGKDGWKVTNLDWKQLAIMIIAIICDIEGTEYYHIELDNSGIDLKKNAFLKTLFEEGKWDLSSFKKSEIDKSYKGWLP